MCARDAGLSGDAADEEARVADGSGARDTLHGVHHQRAAAA